MEFPRDGELTAGSRLRAGAHGARASCPTFPSCCNPAAPNSWSAPTARNSDFLQKRSPTLLGDLRRILTEQVGFGDFVFRSAGDKPEVARASDLNALETLLATVPEDSIAYHGAAQPFFALADGAHRIRAGAEATAAQSFRFRGSRAPAPRPDRIHRRLSPRAEPGADWRVQSRHVSADGDFFLQIGGGSLGGKARGLAFIRHLLHQRSLWPRAFPASVSRCRPTLVLTTEVFDRFLSDNELLDFAIHGTDDDGDRAPLSCGDHFPSLARQAAGASWRKCAIRWRCARPACWRTRSTSRSPACTKPSCWPISTADIQVRLEQLLEAIKLRLCLHLQPARQGVCAGHALSPGRREDGGAFTAGRGRQRTARASIPIFPA